MTSCFLVVAIAGFVLLARVWKNTNVIPGKGVLAIALALSYRFLDRGNPSDIVWLTLLSIAGVGLNNTALYSIPAIIWCSWVAFFTLQLVEHKVRGNLWKQIRRGLLLAIPLVQPIAILTALKMDIIPKPIDIHLLGPRYKPWREAVDHAIGGQLSTCTTSYS